MHLASLKSITKVIHNKRNITFWDSRCRVEGHMDSCHPYNVKQKHEVSFETGLRHPNDGNLVTAVENCDIKIPICNKHLSLSGHYLTDILQACLTTSLQ